MHGCMDGIYFLRMQDGKRKETGDEVSLHSYDGDLPKGADHTSITEPRFWFWCAAPLMCYPADVLPADVLPSWCATPLMPETEVISRARMIRYDEILLKYDEILRIQVWRKFGKIYSLPRTRFQNFLNGDYIFWENIGYREYIDDRPRLFNDWIDIPR